MPEDITTREFREIKRNVELVYKRRMVEKEHNSRRIRYLTIIFILSIVIALICVAEDLPASEIAAYRYISDFFAILTFISMFGLLYYSVQPFKKEDIAFELYNAFKDKGTEKSQKSIKRALFILDKAIYDLKKKMFAEKLHKDIQELYDHLKHRVYPNASKIENSNEQKWESIIRISYKIVNEDGFPNINEELSSIEEEFEEERQVGRIIMLGEKVTRIWRWYNQYTIFRGIFWGILWGILIFYKFGVTLSSLGTWGILISFFTGLVKER